MVSTSIFYTNKTQAVRLPKAVAFPESVEKVEIIKIGNTRVISPVGERWTAFFENEDLLCPDFERSSQPELDNRDWT